MVLKYKSVEVWEPLYVSGRFNNWPTFLWNLYYNVVSTSKLSGLHFGDLIRTQYVVAEINLLVIQCNKKKTKQSVIYTDTETASWIHF